MLRLIRRLKFLVAAAMLLGTMGAAQSSPGDHGALGGQSVRFDVERIVRIPAGDLRRLTLPRLRSGTLVNIEIQAADSTQSVDMHSLQLEILQGSAGLPADDRPGGIPSLSRAWDSVLLYAGPWDKPIRYRAVRDGVCVIVLRQRDRQGSTLALKIRVHLQGGAAASQPEAPYELSRETRTAVAVFSAGLLWTTLLLCGAPIMRAFRDRRRRPEPPWYA